MIDSPRPGAATRSFPSAVPVAVPISFLGLFFAWPVLTMFVDHLSWSTVADVVRDRSLRGIAWFTFWQAVASTVVTLGVGVPLTWATVRWTFPGVSLLRTISTVPFLMPAVVVAAGVLAIVPERGVGAILWAHLSFNVAVVVRVVGARWALVGATLEEAGASLGASPWRVFRLVTWPLLRDAVRNAASLVFVFCFSSFAVIAVLGGVTRRTLETEVFTQAVRLGDIPTATALALVQTAVVVAALWLGRQRREPVEIGAATETPRERHTRDRISAQWLPPVVAAACAAITVAPLVVVAVRSVRYAGNWTLVGWRALFDGTLARVGVDVLEVLAHSLVFAAVAVVIAVPLAMLTVRRESTSLVERLSLAPLLVSSVTLGLGLIVTFDSSPYDWRGATWLVPVVHAVVALPLAIYVLGPAVRAVGNDVLDAAADLGAGALRRWWSIQLPLVRPAVLRAAGISVAVSIGEFGATSFLARSGSMTIPIAIGQLLGRPGPLLQQAGFALVTLTALAIVVTTRSL
ncbi:MAG: ABC transporter permease [Ilumatobacteraceae bacterium]